MVHGRRHVDALSALISYYPTLLPPLMVSLESLGSHGKLNGL